MINLIVILKELVFNGSININMKYNITHALVVLKPGAEYSLDGEDYSDLNWLDSGITKPTETEINNKIAELDGAEAMKLLREKRNRLLAVTDWRASSDLTLSDDWKNYRNELRQIPQTQTDPYNITWPTEPSS